VEPLVEEITLTSGASFPTVESVVYLNFGKERTNARARLVSLIGPTVYQLTSTNAFPTTDFPYQVTLSQGTAIEEVVDVIANNTMLDQLTFATTPLNNHFLWVPSIAAPYVTFTAGTPETVTYLNRTGNVLELAQPTLLQSRHTVGERVMLSPSDSKPATDGNDYAFLFPPDPAGCLRLMFELVRAAGVQIEFLTDR
jgi:hypothetical protein